MKTWLHTTFFNESTGAHAVLRFPYASYPYKMSLGKSSVIHAAYVPKPAQHVLFCHGVHDRKTLIYSGYKWTRYNKLNVVEPRNGTWNGTEKEKSHLLKYFQRIINKCWFTEIVDSLRMKTLNHLRRTARRRRTWVRQWLDVGKRFHYGHYHRLNSRNEDPASFLNFLRLVHALFDELLARLCPPYHQRRH